MSETVPMMRIYWNTEGEVFSKELPMDPDYDALMWLYQIGRLRICTARRAGLLIGVNGFNVGGTLWRKSTMTAIGLILYVLPSERIGIGVRFLKEAEKGLRHIGVKLVVYEPGASVNISPLLKRLGYKSLRNRGGQWEKML